MHFDLATAMMITSLLTFGVGASLSFAISRYPIQLRGAMRVWIGGLFLQALALSAVALSGPRPSVAVLILGNTIYALAFAEMARAIWIFFDRRRTYWLWLPVAVIALNSIALSIVWPAARAHTVLLNAAPLAILQLAVAGPVLYRRKLLRPADVLTGGLFVACAVLAIARGLMEWLIEPGAAPTLHLAMTTSVFVFGSILPMLGTIGFMLMCSDRLGDDLTRLAMVDPLTGAFNRRTLVDRAQAAIVEARTLHSPLALLALDVDHFKRINDDYGHDTGDEVLVRLVRLLGEGLDEGCVLSRTGGEEFAILMPGTDELGACVTAERVRRHVADSSLSINGHAINIRVSIGVAALGVGSAELATLMRAADQAMYAAKRAGRDRVIGASSRTQTGALEGALDVMQARR